MTASAKMLGLGLFVWLGLGLHAAVAYAYLASPPLGREGMWLGLLAYTAGSAALLHRVFSGLREVGRAQRTGASIDPVSGLWSQEAYRVRLQQLWREGGRSGQSWCLLLIGLDDVQGLDAQLGRFHVDRALRVVASALQGNLHQPQHQCYRLGEREFALLLPHCRLEQASELARHLQQALAHSRLRVGRHRSVRLTVSVGLSEVHLGRDWHRVQVERRARQALALARQGGRQQLRSRR